MKNYLAVTGLLSSAEERALAEEMARSTGDVRDVRNQLVVRKAL